MNNLSLTTPNSSETFNFQMVATGQAASSVTVNVGNATSHPVLYLNDDHGNQIGATSTVVNGVLAISLNGLPDGKYHFFVMLGSGSGLANYSATVSAPAVSGADLLVSNLTLANQLLTPGATANVTATIQNIGNAAVASFSGQYFLSPTPTLDPHTEIPLGGTVTLGPIGAGATLTDQRSLVLPSTGLTAGWQYIELVVNGVNSVPQTGAAQHTGIESIAIVPTVGEPNIDQAHATPVVLTGGRFIATGLVLRPGDQNVFQFTAPFTGGVSDAVTLTRNTMEGSLDLVLEDASGKPIRGSVQATDSV